VDLTVQAAKAYAIGKCHTVLSGTGFGNEFVLPIFLASKPPTMIDFVRTSVIEIFFLR
jgi:hypothetical protein